MTPAATSQLPYRDGSVQTSWGSLLARPGPPDASRRSRGGHSRARQPRRGQRNAPTPEHENDRTIWFLTWPDRGRPLGPACASGREARRRAPSEAQCRAVRRPLSDVRRTQGDGRCRWQELAAVAAKSAGQPDGLLPRARGRGRRTTSLPPRCGSRTVPPAPDDRGRGVRRASRGDRERRPPRPRWRRWGCGCPLPQETPESPRSAGAHGTGTARRSPGSKRSPGQAPPGKAPARPMHA